MKINTDANKRRNHAINTGGITGVFKSINAPSAGGRAQQILQIINQIAAIMDVFRSILTSAISFPSFYNANNAMNNSLTGKYNNPNHKISLTIPRIPPGAFPSASLSPKKGAENKFFQRKIIRW